MSQVAACIYRKFFYICKEIFFTEMSQVAACICKKTKKKGANFSNLFEFYIFSFNHKSFGVVYFYFNIFSEKTAK